MSDVPGPKDSKGVQAYRWIVMGALGAIGLMAVKTYERIDKTADSVGTIERSVTALNGRMDAQAERLADHDRRLGRLETPYFRGFEKERATP